MKNLNKETLLKILLLGTLLSLNSCQSLNELKVFSVEKKSLTSEEYLRVKRFLHPMPQELRLSRIAYEISAENCGLISSFEAGVEEKQAIDDFKVKWQKKRKTDLKEGNRQLTIVAGLLKNSSELQKAAENGIFDAKYLSERPNSEQAYVIRIVEKEGKIKVYVAANAPTGLYYGLSTLDQVFDGLSQGEKLVLPHCHIVDWPDLKERGFIANTGGWTFFDETIGKLRYYSDLKLNVHCDWIYMKVSPEKKISYRGAYRKKYLAAKKYFVQEIPILVHMDYLFKPTRNGLSNFPEIASQGKTGKRIYGSLSGNTFCYGNPKSQEIMDQVFEAIANAKMGNRLDVWLAENWSVCHCKLCGGDHRRQLVNEVKHILNAYKKALEINPKLKINLWLSHGTYNHNYALLDLIPKDIGIDIYSGSGPNDTYKSRFGEYFLTPQAEEIAARGFETGAVPSMGPGIMWENIMFPSFMSQMAKLRMMEIKARGLSRVWIWMSEIFNQELNLEAVAEFSWNIDGRTSREFITAWAERKGMNNPVKVAEIIRSMEYPIRALGSGYRTMRVFRSMERIVSMLNGKKPHWGEYFEILKGFEYGNNEELVRARNQCDHALKLARELKNDELIAGASLLKQWVSICERYAFFLETKNAEEKKTAREEVKKLAVKLPELRENWLELKKLDKLALQRVRRKKGGFNEVMKEFEKLK